MRLTFLSIPLLTGVGAASPFLKEEPCVSSTGSSSAAPAVHEAIPTLPTTSFVADSLRPKSLIRASSPCTPSQNTIRNPSFEGSRDVWTVMALGAWSDRDIVFDPAQAHRGNHFLYGHANSSSPATLGLSQTAVRLPNDATVQCNAWGVHMGHTGDKAMKITMEMFVDGISCGKQEMSNGNGGWRRLGGRMKAIGEEHVVSITVVSQSVDGGLGATAGGVSFGIDDVYVSEVC